MLGGAKSWWKYITLLAEVVQAALVWDEWCVTWTWHGSASYRKKAIYGICMVTKQNFYFPSNQDKLAYRKSPWMVWNRKQGISHLSALSMSSFHGNGLFLAGLFLYPLKTWENLLFMFSGGMEKDQWHEMV